MARIMIESKSVPSFIQSYVVFVAIWAGLSGLMYYVSDPHYNDEGAF